MGDQAATATPPGNGVNAPAEPGVADGQARAEVAHPPAEPGGQADSSQVVIPERASEEGQPMYQLESLCMRCGKQGTTRLLLTKIPHFREIVVMAFDCPHCGEKNNEIQFAGALQPQGIKITLSVPAGDSETLDRQVVKSDTAVIRIPELDFEIPADTQKGSLSTVEGVISRAVEELGALQEERRKADPETAAKLDSFLAKLEDCAAGKTAFTLELDDLAGNSFIQSPCAPAPDPQLTVKHYERKPEENEKLGFKGANAGPVQAAAEKPSYVPAGTVRMPHGSVGATAANRAIAAECTPEQAEALLGYSTPEEVMAFPAHCSACGAPSETRMYITNIPYFKEVIIMSTTCDECGFRSSELKAGGSISDKGRRICLLVRSIKDLTRDVIKSDTASVAIPELDLELTPGTLGGMVTTVEGLITGIDENLAKVLPFQLGDSAPEIERGKWKELGVRLKQLLEAGQDWHLIIDDALANSFIAPNTGESMEDDPQLEAEEYTRTWDQDEELGLHDMNTGDNHMDGEQNTNLAPVTEEEKPVAASTL